MSEVLALIPARGGSKGIARKNLVELDGKPLVVHSIGHALAAARVSRVVVSTEDEEIAKVARAAGAEVPFRRPPELAADETLDWPVFAHALAALAVEGYQPDLVVHLRPTTPHREASWIDACVDLLMAHEQADSVRSVSPPSQHPYRVFRLGEDGFLDPIMKHEHPEPYVLRRQDQPAMYYYNCVIDVAWRRTIEGQQSMTGSRILPYVMRAEDVFDIDTPRDLELARLFHRGGA